MCQLNGFNVMHVLEAGIKLEVYISPTDRNPTGLAQSTETFPIADISKEKWEKRENLGSQMTG